MTKGDDMKEIIYSDKAPKAVGPYSQGVKAKEFIFLSGQIALDSQTGEISRGGAAEQTRIILNNIKELLAAAGCGLEDIVKANVYLTDIGEFKNVNEVYAGFFGENPPARCCVEVSALPKNASVEIEVIAAARTD